MLITAEVTLAGNFFSIVSTVLLNHFKTRLDRSSLQHNRHSVASALRLNRRKRKLLVTFINRLRRLTGDADHQQQPVEPFICQWKVIIGLCTDGV